MNDLVRRLRLYVCIEMMFDCATGLIRNEERFWGRMAIKKLMGDGSICGSLHSILDTNLYS